MFSHSRAPSSFELEPKWLRTTLEAKSSSRSNCLFITSNEAKSSPRSNCYFITGGAPEFLGSKKLLPRTMISNTYSEQIDIITATVREVAHMERVNWSPSGANTLHPPRLSVRAAMKKNYFVVSSSSSAVKAARASKGTPACTSRSCRLPS